MDVHRKKDEEQEAWNQALKGRLFGFLSLVLSLLFSFRFVFCSFLRFMFLLRHLLYHANACSIFDGFFSCYSRGLLLFFLMLLLSWYHDCNFSVMLAVNVIRSFEYMDYVHVCIYAYVCVCV